MLYVYWNYHLKQETKRIINNNLYLKSSLSTLKIIKNSSNLENVINLCSFDTEILEYIFYLNRKPILIHKKPNHHILKLNN